jgi:MFS family permease
MHPKESASWYGVFPQLGAPLGLFLASTVFWSLLHFISQDALLSWGWRVPFLASIVLIAIGLWVRLSITETPEFQKAIEKAERVAVPALELIRHHRRTLFLCTFMALVTFVLFYICSAYLLSYAVKVAGISFLNALRVQIYGSVLFGITTIAAGKLGDRFGQRELLIVSTIAVALLSFGLGPLLTAGIGGIYAFTTLGMLLIGLNCGF